MALWARFILFERSWLLWLTDNPNWLRICPIVHKFISALLDGEIQRPSNTMSSKCFWYFWAWLCTCCLLRVPIWRIKPRKWKITCWVTRFQSLWYSLMASKKRACSSLLHSPSHNRAIQLHTFIIFRRHYQPSKIRNERRCMCSDCAFVDNDGMLLVRLVFIGNNRRGTFLFVWVQ